MCWFTIVSKQYTVHWKERLSQAVCQIKSSSDVTSECSSSVKQPSYYGDVITHSGPRERRVFSWFLLTGRWKYQKTGAASKSDNRGRCCTTSAFVSDSEPEEERVRTTGVVQVRLGHALWRHEIVKLVVVAVCHREVSEMAARGPQSCWRHLFRYFNNSSYRNRQFSGTTAWRADIYGQLFNSVQIWLTYWSILILIR